MKSETAISAISLEDQLTTFEAARLLGLAVRSVQLMADRGELNSWKTPGGHRRISRESIERWMRERTAIDGLQDGQSAGAVVKVLLIEDSIHFQNLVSLLFAQHFPEWDLHIANDGVTGLVMYGEVQPDILIVDILLPGIDGAGLITTLRSHSKFAKSGLVVVTSLDEGQRALFAFALQGVDVIHKPRLVAELPGVLAVLARSRSASLSL